MVDCINHCICKCFHGQDLMVVVGFSGSLAVFWTLFFLMFRQSVASIFRGQQPVLWCSWFGSLLLLLPHYMIVVGIQCLWCNMKCCLALMRWSADCECVRLSYPCIDHSFSCSYLPTICKRSIFQDSGSKKFFFNGNLNCCCTYCNSRVL